MRAAWPLVAAILFSAGCVGLGPAGTTAPDADALLSQVRYPEILAEAMPFAVDDGTLLDAWVYRPDTSATGERVPIVINYSPYWSNLAGPTAERGDAFSQYLIEHYVPRGYAVALVSVRGTGLSEGCFWIGGPREIADVDQMTTYLATQPWSNGNVAAVAKSYDGTVAQMLLTTGNPHVKTIVPVSPISEWYKYSYFGGLAYTGSEAFNVNYLQTVSFQQTDDPSDGTYQQTPTRFCEETADNAASQMESNALGNDNAYWQERNYTAMLPDDITASVFYVHGLQDWNVKPDHMWPWLNELYARDVTIKAWLGQWEHDYPHRDDWNTTLLRWFDSELKGIDNGIRAEPLVNVQDQEGTWRVEDDWPPTRAVATKLYPSIDGTLGVSPGEGASTYGDAPNALVPNAALPVAIFETTIERATRIAGVPTLTAIVSSTGPRATLAATLFLDGEVVDQGFLDLAHRDSLAEPSPLVPGERYAIGVPFYPQDLFVPAGSTLTLLLAAAAPEDAPVGVTSLGAGALVTITHGDGTALTLPLLDVAGDRIEARQPEDLGCWTC